MQWAKVQAAQAETLADVRTNYSATVAVNAVRSGRFCATMLMTTVAVSTLYLDCTDGNGFRLRLQLQR